MVALIKITLMSIVNLTVLLHFTLTAPDYYYNYFSKGWSGVNGCTVHPKVPFSRTMDLLSVDFSQAKVGGIGILFLHCCCIYLGSGLCSEEKSSWDLTKTTKQSRPPKRKGKIALLTFRLWVEVEFGFADYKKNRPSFARPQNDPDE